MEQKNKINETWKRIRIGIIITIFIGAFAFYYTFNHTFAYLECKDVKLFEENFDFECECKWTSNICYNTLKTTYYWDGNETKKTKEQIWEVIKDFGK